MIDQRWEVFKLTHANAIDKCVEPTYDLKNDRLSTGPELGCP